MYETPRLLSGPFGNNAFAYTEKTNLFVPALKDGDFLMIEEGGEIVFREKDEENEKIQEEKGLQSFIRGKWNNKTVYIFDNHNHALAFWADAVSRGEISPGFDLVHIDMHSDLWKCEYDFDITRIFDDTYVEDFVDKKTNVGNYIDPAIRSGLVGRVIRIEGESDLDAHQKTKIQKNSVLNLDLDFFESELDYISFERKKEEILRFASMAKIITIATSPYFIDFKEAKRALIKIFS